MHTVDRGKQHLKNGGGLMKKQMKKTSTKLSDTEQNRWQISF